MMGVGGSRVEASARIAGSRSVEGEGMREGAQGQMGRVRWKSCEIVYDPRNRGR